MEPIRSAPNDAAARLRDSIGVLLVHEGRRWNGGEVTKRKTAGLPSLFAVGLLLAASPVPSSPEAPASPEIRRRAVRDFVDSRQHDVLDELLRFLAIPNLARDREGIHRNADHLVAWMNRLGLDSRLLEASDPGAPPAVFAESKTPGASRTLVLYAHYDGQPADPAQWQSDPWRPVLRSARIDEGGKILLPPGARDRIDPGWRLYARSAADDKSGVAAILWAFAALREKEIAPTSNLKFFFDGEEEAGSPHLEAIAAAHRSVLSADAWIICDGPVHASGRRQVVFGVRGDANVDLTVYGPARPLHSGHYGNWAPNPALRLARLLASMKEPGGRVRIPGWYDDVEPLKESERKAIAAVPESESMLRGELGIAQPEGEGRSLVELLTLPSLNINGMRSGDIGDQARNVIPTTASAVLDLRLVLGNDHRRQVERLIRFVKGQGFLVLDREPTMEQRRHNPLIATILERPGGYNAARTPMDLPISRSVIAAVQSVSEKPVVILPSLGGSLPVSILTQTLGTRAVIVPIANPDSNQHAENENLRLGNLWDGIEALAAVMTME